VTATVYRLYPSTTASEVYRVLARQHLNWSFGPEKNCGSPLTSCMPKWSHI